VWELLVDNTCMQKAVPAGARVFASLRRSVPGSEAVSHPASALSSAKKEACKHWAARTTGVKLKAK
jgi:hypothetical protein